MPLNRFKHIKQMARLEGRNLRLLMYIDRTKDMGEGRAWMFTKTLQLADLKCLLLVLKG